MTGQVPNVIIARLEHEEEIAMQGLCTTLGPLTRAMTKRRTNLFDNTSRNQTFFSSWRLSLVELGQNSPVLPILVHADAKSSSSSCTKTKLDSMSANEKAAAGRDPRNVTLKWTNYPSAFKTATRLAMVC